MEDGKVVTDIRSPTVRTKRMRVLDCNQIAFGAIIRYPLRTAMMFGVVIAPKNRFVSCGSL